MNQQEFRFSDPTPEGWVYTCSYRTRRWRAHRIVKTTAKQLWVSKRSVPIERIGAVEPDPRDTVRPFRLPLEWFYRDGYHKHTGHRDSPFYARIDDALAEECRLEWEEEQRQRAEMIAEHERRYQERQAWRAAHPEEAAEQDRRFREDIEERLRRSFGEMFGAPDADARVLGINWPCSESALKAAYRTLAKRTHPDLGGSADEFRRINEAYERLAAAI